MFDGGSIARGWRTTIARRPAAPLAVAFMLGIAAERVAPVTPAVWLAVAAAAAVIAVWSRVTSFLFLIAFLLAGLAAAQLETGYFNPRDVAHYTTESPRLAQIELHILSPPQLVTETVLARPLPPRQICRAEVTQISTNSGWKPACGNVSLTVDQPHPQLAVGQIVRATGVLQRPMPASNPGQIDLAAFYRAERILATFSVPHADALQIVSQPRFSPLEKLRAKVRNLLADGFSSDRASDFALLEALTLGDRDAAMRAAQDDFAHSGTAHLLAVSGLHVVLVGAVAFLFLGRLVGLRPRAVTIGAMAAVALYALVVVPGTPAVRATLLCAAYAMNRLARRKPDGLQLLSLCALCVLVWHPHDLFSAGFQLSFAAVAGIIIAARHVAAFLHRMVEDEHARVARSFRPPDVFGASLLFCRDSLIEMTAMSLVAWAVLMPLIVFHFGQTNPWAIATGLLALPLVVLGLVGGLVKIMLTLALPSFAAAWATLSWLPIVGLRHTVHWLADWPGANLTTPPPSTWLVILFYVLLALPLLPWTWQWIRRSARLAPVAGCAMVLLPGLFGQSPAPARDQVRITLLSIGAGQVGVIELPNGHAVLIDDGSDSVPDVLRASLVPYLHSRGVRAIDAIILSHPDYDHISAAADTAEMFHPARVIVNPVFRAQSQASAPAAAMLERFDAMHVPVDITSKGRQIRLDDETKLDVLWPPADRAIASTNNAGLVLRLTCHGRSVLFPADIQTPTERELLLTPAALRSDVLVAPHHGSSEVSTPEFLAAVHPLDVLSSNDRRLSKKQREFDAMAKGYPLYRTSRFGAVTVRIDKNGDLKIETFLHPN